MSDVVSFNDEPARHFVSEVERSADELARRKNIDGFNGRLDEQGYSNDWLQRHQTWAEAVTNFVDGVVQSMGGIPVLIVDADANISITVPTIDGRTAWESLTETDRAWILLNAPEMILEHGASPALMAQALANFQANHADDFVVLEGTVRGQVVIDIRFVELSAGVQATLALMGDGSTVVTFRIDGSASLQGEAFGGEVKGGGNGSATWEFTFPPEDNALVERIIAETRDSLTDDLNPTDYEDVFERHGEYMSAEVLQLGVELSAGFKSPTGNEDLNTNVAGGINWSWDTVSGTHTRGFYVDVQVPTLDVRVDVSESFAENGNRTSVDIEIDGSLPDALGLPAHNNGSVKLSVDMSDPRAVSAYQTFFDDPLSEDNIMALFAVTSVTLTTSRTIVDEDTPDGPPGSPIKISGSVDAEVGLVTLIKPPHTTAFIPVVAPTAAAGSVDRALNSLGVDEEDVDDDENENENENEEQR